MEFKLVFTIMNNAIRNNFIINALAKDTFMDICFMLSHWTGTAG
jgi:hypothetical protein